MRFVTSAGNPAGTRGCPEMWPHTVQRSPKVGPNGNVSAFGTPGQSKEFVDTRFDAGCTNGGGVHFSGGFDAIHDTMPALCAQPAGD